MMGDVLACVCVASYSIFSTIKRRVCCVVLLLLVLLLWMRITPRDDGNNNMMLLERGERARSFEVSS